MTVPTLPFLRGCALRLLVALLLLAAAAALTLSTAAATPLPPPNGDWVVDSDTSVSGATLQVNGSIQVANNSVLSLDNLTLTLSAPGGGVAWVNVSAGSTALFDNVTVDRGSPATALGGRVEGGLTLARSTWRNITAAYPNGTGGLFVSGGQVVVSSSLLADCVTAFTLSSGDIRVTDSRVEGCSDTLVRGDPALAGPLNITVVRTRFSASGGLFNATCSTCSGVLTLNAFDIVFTGAPWARGSLLDISGPSNWSVLRTRFERVNVTAVNFSLQSVYDPTGITSRVAVLDTTVRNTTVMGTLAWLGLFYIGGRLDAAAVTVEDSVAPGLGGILLANQAVLSSTNGSFGVALRRIDVGQASVWVSSGGTFAVDAYDSTIGSLVVTTPPAGTARLTVVNCTMPGRQGLGASAGVGAFAYGSLPLELEIRASHFRSRELGLRASGPVNVSLQNSSFYDVGTAIQFAAPFHFTLRDYNFSNVQFFINLTGGPGATEGSDLVLENLRGTNLTTLLTVSAPFSLSPAPPINVTLTGIRLVGSGAGVLNYTASGQDRMTLRNITASGNGTTPGIWIQYGHHLNLTLSDVSLSDHSTAVRIERAIASWDRDDWNFSNVTVKGAINGIELVCAHVIDAQFAIVDSHIDASQSSVITVGAAGNISGGSIGGGGNLDLHDSQVTLRDTFHDFQRVVTDFRLGEGFVEAWGNWSAYNLTFRFAPTGRPAAGWRLNASIVSGAPCFDTMLDASGRSTQPLNYGLIYRFVQNLTNFDARAVDGTLTIPGRKPTVVHVEFNGSLSALVDVVDEVVPDVSLPDEQLGGVYTNRSTLALAIDYWDPEAGLTNVSVEVSGVSRTDLFVSGAPSWWNLTVNLTLPFPAMYLIEIYARDAAGNQLHTQRYVVFDTTPPTVAILDPVPPGPLNYSAFVLRVAIEPDVIYLVLNGDAGRTVNGTALPNWTVALSLAEGLHNFTIDVRDRAGNWGRVAFAFEIDLTPPSPLVTGIFDGLEVNAMPLEVAVTTGARDTVVFDGLERAGTGGTFHFAVDLSLRATVHTLVVTDAAGNSVAYTYSVNLDVWPPTIELQAPFLAGGVYFVNFSSIDVAALVSLDTDHVEVEGLSAFADTASLVRMHLQFAEGQHQVTFVAVDRTGDRTAVSFTLVVDFKPPSLLESDPPDGASISTHTAALHLRLDEGAEVRWSSFTAPGPAGTANLSVPIVPGANTFTLLLVDPAGNSRTVTLTYQGDFVRPSILLSSPSNGTVTEATSVRIEGRTEAGASVFLGSLRLDVAPDGTFSVDVPLQAGENTIVLTARDPAGNEASAGLVITRGAGANSTPLLIGLLGAFGAVAVAVLYRRFRSLPPAPPRPPIVEPPPPDRGPRRPPR